MSQLRITEFLQDISPTRKLLGGVALSLGASIFVISKLQDYKQTRELTRLRAQKQAERDAAFADLRKKFPLTSPNFKRILALPFETLRLELHNRKLTATEVVSAFIAKSLEVTDEFNCVTEFVPNALKLAAELDKLEEIKGPFHGIPFCIKDDTDLEGMDCTVGFSKNLYKPVTESAVLVRMLMDAGAIPICKTNLPQSCLSFGSENPIYGKTLNPLNKKLSPGGSSSGTGCLVAAGGVPLGTGGDTGGSMRLPGHFNGIAAFKPTSNRLSRKGCTEMIQNAVGVFSIGFVLSKYAKEVALVFKTFTENNLHYEYDNTVVPIPWNETLFSSTEPLRIGYYTSFPEYPPVGDTEETVLKAKKALESLGHTVVPFQIPFGVRIFQLCSKLFFADLGKRINENLKHDEVASVIQGLHKTISTPLWKRQILTSVPIVRRWFQHLEDGFSTRYSSDLWDGMGEREKLRAEILDQMRALNLDLLLAPVFPFPACGVDDLGTLCGELVYTALWNVVDFPAGNVKFSTETGNRHNEAMQILKRVYRKDELTIKNAIGMPIGVQLIGKPYMEEVVLRGLVALDNLYNESGSQYQ